MHNRIQRRHSLYVNTGKRSQKAYPIAKILYGFFCNAVYEFPHLKPGIYSSTTR